MNQVKFNTNNYVRVRPTETGRKVMTKEGRDFYKPDAEGYIRMQAWCWIALFGPHTRLGGQPPTETDMFIEVEESPAEVQTARHRFCHACNDRPFDFDQSGQYWRCGCCGARQK